LIEFPAQREHVRVQIPFNQFQFYLGVLTTEFVFFARHSFPLGV
jgi:hypothetical protein